jgi:hypothetical protein
MTELCSQPPFLEEALGEFRVRRQARRHHLQRDLAIQRLLHGQEDRCHAAFPEAAQNAIAGDVDTLHYLGHAHAGLRPREVIPRR